MTKFSQKGKEGYLLKKVQNHYEFAYFKIKNGYLYEFADEKTNKARDAIPLNKLEKCALDSEK